MGVGGRRAGGETSLFLYHQKYKQELNRVLLVKQILLATGLVQNYVLIQTHTDFHAKVLRLQRESHISCIFLFAFTYLKIIIISGKQGRGFTLFSYTVIFS